MSDQRERASIAALRRCALAVVVTRDLDAEPADDGVLLRLPGGGTHLVPWSLVGTRLGDDDAESPVSRGWLGDWLSTVCRVAALGPDDLASRIRPVGLPLDHIDHPHSGWARSTVLGGAMDLGLGVLGRDGDPDRVDVLSPDVAQALDLDVSSMWAPAVRYLERMGSVAAVRYEREPEQPLRPMGDCDVVTLLGSAAFRAALTAKEQMRAVAVPVRSRGWLDLSRVDPAFVVSAAMLTEPQDRGFTRPVLVTADEVVLAREGATTTQVLKDEAPDEPKLPPLRLL